MSAQLPLAFRWQVPSQSFSNYIAKSNQTVYQTLLQVLDKKEELSMYLWGESGTGKSHLLQAACQYASARNQIPVYLPFSQLQHISPDALDGLETVDLVCLDDIQQITSSSPAMLLEWEQALFGLFNRLHENQVPLLITANTQVQSLGLNLEDLVSRLSWGYSFKLEPLPENCKRIILQKYATSLGLSLPDKVADYLLSHHPENLKQLIIYLDKLNYASLAKKRRLSIPFIREVLNDRFSGE
ncbi:DnaA regulatory inactivator Hda [Candidatus Venteria ishoeyi]|uniref:DnaA regulatory inactivator Hda n=2 Tax=Candidatus Venteria ishoeyi TaxID=1899563 RepID=A0A1H6F6H3_9GAMM|nr:DnaA regulatory inactivator Hda [Candidatus Venteria ishoeyi]SEH04899.1 DnaA regulatory inactivator Hda [Candidatus Venteria ishoeyi]